MQQRPIQCYAGAIAGVLAALAIAGGLWVAAYHAPQADGEAAVSSSAQLAGDSDYGQHWAVQPVQVSDDHTVPASGRGQAGFFVGNCAVPIEHLYQLPAARDEVQALYADAVHSVGAEEAQWLSDDDLVVGVRLYGHARCYPHNILARHSLVNDQLGGQPILMYYDPPSATYMAFERPVRADETLDFGSSGIGYGGAGLAYDRQTESLWTAIGGPALDMGQPLSGPAREERLGLTPVAVEAMTWAAWRKLWPDTTVMSPQTGHDFDYSFDPYTRVLGPDGQALDYYHGGLLLAPEWMSDATGTLPDKTDVLGVLLPDGPLAIPVQPVLSAVADGHKTFTRDSPLGQLQLVADGPTRRIHVTTPGNVRPPQLRQMWFAWRWCHPETELWQPVEVVGGGSTTDASLSGADTSDATAGVTSDATSDDITD